MIRTEGPGPKVAKSISLYHIDENCVNERLVNDLRKHRKRRKNRK